MIIDRLFESEDYILFTDSWHPTLNPSSRMPVHHLRYNSLFAGRTGILTEKRWLYSERNGLFWTGTRSEGIEHTCGVVSLVEELR